MLASFIKYFSIIICSLYTFKKLLGFKIPVKRIPIDLLFAAALSVSVYYMRIWFAPISIPVMIIIALVYIKLITGTKMELSITTVILSYCISYAFSAVSATLTTALFKLLHVESIPYMAIFLTIVTAVIQFGLTVVPFRFRRLKKGMPFLIKRGASNVGVLISVILLSCIIILGNNKNPADFIYVITFVLVLLSGVFILFWWRGV